MSDEDLRLLFVGLKAGVYRHDTLYPETIAGMIDAIRRLWAERNELRAERDRLREHFETHESYPEGLGG